MLRPFWFKKHDNYGDILTPYILNRLGKRHLFANIRSFDSLFIGSIAKLARPGTHVYGSGFIRKQDEVCANANWHFVRGPLSREMVLKAGGKCPEIYGDAALILPELIPAMEKRHDVAYIPHHVEYDIFPRDYMRIQLSNHDVVFTTEQITRCRKVISSSLHGIIVAHAYGIPAAYVSKSFLLSGDGMKFTDYYRSVGLEPVLSTVENPVFQVPTEINVSEAFRILKGIK